MAHEKQFAVLQLDELKWPPSLQLPSRRFRLFIAADTSEASTQLISEFALAALNSGMVYFCSSGPGCERFHDIVDEVVTEDSIGESRFAGPASTDVVMTTWHEHETLEEALDFFATCAVPTDGFAADSDFRLVICVNNPDWAAAASRFHKSAEFLV
jgi:hypothetical protein